MKRGIYPLFILGLLSLTGCAELLEGLLTPYPSGFGSTSHFTSYPRDGWSYDFSLHFVPIGSENSPARFALAFLYYGASEVGYFNYRISTSTCYAFKVLEMERKVLNDIATQEASQARKFVDEAIGNLKKSPDIGKEIRLEVYAPGLRGNKKLVKGLGKSRFLSRYNTGLYHLSGPQGTEVRFSPCGGESYIIEG